MVSPERSKTGSEPDQFLEALRKFATPEQLSICTNLESDYQHEFELIWLKTIFSTIIYSNVYSNNHPVFNKREREVIAEGNRKAYPENRIEGFFSKSSALSLILLIVTVKKYSETVLLAIAALPDHYRDRLLNFVNELPYPISFTSYLAPLDSTPKGTCLP
jgi:hypothetical protein